MDRLPIDLLVRIGEYILDSEYPDGTLPNLSLCCRHFHNVFEPMIYHSIIHDDPMSVEFVRFIMRLWRQPELASRVRRLEIDWMECGPYSIDKLKVDKLKEDTDVVLFIQEALDEIFTLEEKKMRSEWEKHFNLNDLCIEVWLGLLFVWTNNLRTIEFTHYVSELMLDILHKVANRQRPFYKAISFPHLQEVRDVLYEWTGGLT